MAAISNPYSTADAPASRRSPLSLLTTSSAGAETAADGRAGLVERTLDERAQAEHDADDDGRDGRHHEAVLDSRRTAVPRATAHLAKIREHRGVPFSFLVGERLVLE